MNLLNISYESSPYHYINIIVRPIYKASVVEGLASQAKFIEKSRS